MVPFRPPRGRRLGVSSGEAVVGFAVAGIVIGALTAAFRQIPPTETFWPKAVMTYIVGATAVFAFLHTLYKYARVLVQLNGLGQRVTDVELSAKALQGDTAKLDRMVERGVIAREEIRESVGRAQKSADGCNDEVDRLRTDVVAFLQDMRREAAERNERVVERLAKLETRLERHDR